MQRGLNGGPYQAFSRAFNTSARAASSIVASGSVFFANALTEELVQLIEGAFDIVPKSMVDSYEKRCVLLERQAQTASDPGRFKV